MPEWEIHIAEMYTFIVDADTQAEALALAKEANEAFAYEKQRYFSAKKLTKKD